MHAVSRLPSRQRNIKYRQTGEPVELAYQENNISTARFWMRKRFPSYRTSH